MIANTIGGVTDQLKVDATRYGKSRFYFRYALFPNPAGFMIWFRIFAFICKIDRTHIFSTIVKQVYKINSLIMGYDIPLHTQIGKGFCLLHYPEVVINWKAKIGDFVTIFNGVTIGAQFWGKKKGYPTIGNNIIIFPGSRIVGNISIGNNVIIGANSVVIDDVPDNCVVAGIPARIVSELTEEQKNCLPVH